MPLVGQLRWGRGTVSSVPKHFQYLLMTAPHTLAWSMKHIGRLTIVKLL